ncbi:MAG: hypothetical protein B6D44_01220 [Ignavibacteriales bacterium UTCHB2]|jgi:predicted SAM-dependent methyltransferase|nr:MAG: hypothetical protein B6D44_01220 [Ignavibacteriales bacterium UTCHB2]
MNRRVLLNVGCGAVRPKNWINTDSSINALIQKLPFVGKYFARQLIKSSVYESDNVKYMNLNKYWKFEDQNVDVVYASHIFEHLSDKAKKIFLIESYRVLKSGGVLRIVVPDLYKVSKKYIMDFESGDEDASHSFLHSLNLHKVYEVSSAFKNKLKKLISWFQKYPHLHKYMYDQYSLTKILNESGFRNIKVMEMGKSDRFAEINDVEVNRDTDISLYIECEK